MTDTTLQPPTLPEGITLHRPLDTLVTWKGNYNEGDVGGIMSSIVKFGYNRTIAVWRENIVMAGNHTMLALKMAQKEGYLPKRFAPDPDPNDDTPQKIIPDGNGIIVDEDGRWWVLVSDCATLEYKEAVGYAIADNEWARRAVRDERALLNHLIELEEHAQQTGDDDLMLAMGYDEDEMDFLEAMVNDDQNKSLDDLGDEYGETDEDGDALTNSMTTSPIIRVQVNSDIFQRFHDLMDGAKETEQGDRLGEILFGIDESLLSWIQD